MRDTFTPTAGPRGGLRVLLLLLGLLAPAPLRAQEVAPVTVQGEPVFTVTARGDTSAAVRARRVGERIGERLLTDEPLAPVRAARADTGAVVLVAGDTLLRVTPRDAEVATARPLEPGAVPRATMRLAEEWAEALREAFARVAAEERERVVVEGIPLFEVGGVPELRAARRAAAISLRVGEAARAADEPEIRAVRRGAGAAVVADGRALVEVSPAEAAARDTTPLALAEAWAEEVRAGVEILREQRTWPFVLRVLGLALAATLAAAAVHWLLRRLLRRLEARHRFDERVRESFALVAARWGISFLQFLTWTTLAVLVLWIVPRTRPFVYAALDRALEALGRATDWLVGEGLVVALIVVTTVLIARFLGDVVRHLVHAYGVRHGGRVALRAGTLAGTMDTATQLLVLFIGVLAVLGQLDVDPVPLLASAGVAGIALGFGVQSLIRDFFTGFFILLEDQYGVGDVIRVGGITGKVEQLTLRITQIRGLDGSLTSIPNGEILSVTNLSKDWAQVVLDVRVALGEDVARATEVIARTAKALADDWPDRVRGEPEVLGVETVDPAARAITIRVILKTAPLEQWAVSRELRRRLVDAFEEEGIEVPPRSAFGLPEEGAERPPGP